MLSLSAVHVHVLVKAEQRAEPTLPEAQSLWRMGASCGVTLHGATDSGLAAAVPAISRMTHQFWSLGDWEW